MNQILKSFQALKQYCEKENFKGWDPYDGLNSKIFQAIHFFKKSAICRLIMIQGFKRSPINFRKLALVPKQYNAKGIGLFLSGYCNLYEAISKNDNLEKYIGSKQEILDKINELATLLISLQSKGNYHGACWGYNFDWQARRVFLFPKNTPTVVATCFCATALIEAYEITKNIDYFEIALSSAEFVIKDLHRTDLNGGFLFSYSPLPGNDTVYNASFLGSKLLSICYKYTGKHEYKILAEKSVNACCKGQQKDGGWVYGLLPKQSWIDSFHTGYNIEALNAYMENTKDNRYFEYMDKGFEYYVNNFFETAGKPKYYNNQTYPIDIHCPAQLIITLSKLNKFNQYPELASNVLKWTLRYMQSPKGYFYYQLKSGISSKISYMRWSNAFMFNALSHYIKHFSVNKYE